MIHQTASSLQDRCIRKGSMHFQSVFVSKKVIKSPTWDETHYTLISTVCVLISSQHATGQENFHGLEMALPRVITLRPSVMAAKGECGHIVLALLVPFVVMNAMFSMSLMPKLHVENRS